MTDGRPTAAGCVEPEILAAFMDGRLEPRERAVVEAHLAECEDCYETWMEGRLVNSEVSAPGKVIPLRPNRRWVVAAAIAAMLFISLTLGRNWFASPDGLLDELAGASPGRPSEGRLADLPWDALPDRSRAVTSPDLSPEVTIAVARLKQALNKERNFATLHANGAGELVLGNFDAAIRSFRDALALQNSPHAMSDLSAALIARGNASGRKMDFAEAFEVASQALKLEGNLPEATFNRSIALERLEQRTQAVESWEEFLRLESESAWADEARRRLEALRKVEKIPDRESARKTVLESNIPAWAAAISRGQDGTDLLHTAIALAATADDGSPDRYTTDAALSLRDNTSKRHIAEAILDFHQGLQAAAGRDYPRADEMFGRAESNLRRLGSPIRYAASLGRAAALYSMHKLEEASAVVEKLDAELPDRYLRVRGRTKWLRGIILMARGHQMAGLAEYEQSVAAYTMSGESSNAAFVSGLMAEGYYLLGDHQRSWQYRVPSIAGAPRAVSLLAAGLAARNQGWPQLAGYFQDEAIAAAKAAGDDRGTVDSLRERALSHARAQSVVEARRALQEARLLAEKGTGSDWVRLRAELDLATAQVADRGALPEALEAADRALRFFRSAGILVRLPASYLAKADVLEALNQPAEARAVLSEGLAKYQDQRRRLPPGVMSASLGDMARELVDRIVRLALDANDPNAAFAALDENRSGSGGSDALSEPLTPEVVRAKVPDGVAVLSYAVCDSEILIWGIGERTTFARERFSKPALDSLVMRAIKGDPEAERELYRRLIQPTLDVLEPNGVVIVIPDGPLFQLPFALLRDGKDRYLVETQGVAMAPSVAWLLRGKPSGANVAGVRSIGAFGNPAFDRAQFPTLADLPASEREARSVTEPYDVRTTKIGSEATRSAFQASLRTDDVVHFAGHALIDRLDAQTSRLALARDGLASSFTAEDVAALRGIRARLIVLAACQSAGGPISRSEGAMGIAQAFLQSGAASVVASITDVGDESSEPFFKDFHEHYAKNGNAIRALQHAQRKALKDGERRNRGWASVVAFSGWNSVAGN
jgi:tetratricopeptide (TPR) repeat protein